MSGVDGPDVLDVCGRIGEDIKGCQLLAQHPGVVLGMVVEIDVVARSLSIASGDGVLRHVHGLAVEHLAPMREDKGGEIPCLILEIVLSIDEGCVTLASDDLE